MSKEYNVYCDESCHLPNDDSKVMVIGAIWCPKANRRSIFARIREIKARHNFKPNFEIKWNKVSKKAVAFYIDLINYFFDDDDLHFRCIVIPDKTKLDHKAFNQTHDEFYYKMYFDLLKVILSPQSSYYFYLDIKDTNSKEKISKLKDVLRNNHYDFHKQIVKEIQHVQSREVELLQLTDLITGAIGYANRGLTTNAGKLAIIDKIKSKSKYSLTQSTLYKEDKMNIFIWHGKSTN